MQKKDVDTSLAIIVLILLFFGMVMISSVSVYPSYLRTLDYVQKGILDEPNNSYFVVRSIGFVIIWVIAMSLVSKIPYYLYEKYAFRIFGASFFFLLAVYIPHLWKTYNGARWWIDIPWLPSIQPVEFAKLGLIIFLAFFLKKRSSVIGRMKEWFLTYFAYVGAIFFLLALQPDFGSILILSPVVLSMYFIGKWNSKYVLYGILAAFLGALLVYGFGKTPIGSALKVGYISSRIDNYLRPSKQIAESFRTGNQKQSDKDLQLRNGFIALGSGGFLGLGFGSSIQKFGYLPEVEWDFIFSVIVEELGFRWWTFIIIMYLLLAHRWYMISRWVKDSFGKYLAFGITTLFIVQAFINIGVNLNVIPLTGVTLPLVSYGGSSVISLMIAAGILLAISRHVEIKPQNLSEALQSWRKVIL